MTVKDGFENPYEVPAVPGTEGWEEMYPYYLLFERGHPARMADDADRFWFRAINHLPDPLYPLDANLACGLHYPGFSALANRALQMPVMRGFDLRVLNGHVYVESVEVQDPAEIAARERVSQPRLDRILQDWENHCRETFVVADELVEEMQRIEFSELLDAEPEEVIPQLARHFPGLELHRQYLRLWDVLARMGQQTLKAQLPSKNQYFIFGEEMRRLFPGLPDKAIPQMLQGFEALAFRPVEELQKLACAALELAVADALLGHDGWEETARALAESEGGRKWLVRFDEARRPWFEMSGATGWQKQSLAWNDDLNVPLARIRSYVAALRRGEDISRPRAAVLAERDRVTQEYLERLRDPAARQTFERLLALTRALAPASENHNFYHTGRFHSLYNRKIRSLGRVLVAHGVLEDPEEIFLLNRQELDGTVWDVYQSWSRSKEPAGKYYWPARLARRREILARLADWAPPPALGRVPKQLRSPFAIVHFGLTSEALQAWLEAARGEEGESLRLTGFPGGPGSVEGIARVCRTTGDLCRLQPGEILVAPTTGPAWAPAFQALGGCVTDSGGMFCHAAIVAREYGLPAVIGTGYGTARIRSGDRIRVDGDLGVVEVLERKE